MNVFQRCFVAAMTIAALSGCDTVSPTPIAIPRPPILIAFTDPVSQVSISDFRDAQDQIVQFNTAGELIWTRDGTRLPGFPLSGGYISAEKVCACAFEIRFGTQDGERRAYVTADYGHYNPGSVVDLEVADGKLVVTETDVYPAGTFTMSGFVTEVTSAGRVPVAAAGVSRLYGTGYQFAATDAKGFYSIKGLYPGSQPVFVTRDGFLPFTATVSVGSDTQFDVDLVRQP